MKEENIKYLSNVIDENKLSHAFLVESNNYEDVMNSVFKLFLEKKMIFNIDDIENNISVRILRPIDNLIDKQTIAESILNPIRRAELSHLNGMEKMKEIRDNILTTVDQEQMVEFDTLLTKLMSGFAMLAIDGCDFMLSIGVQSFAYRSISEPSNEVVQRGSRESFVEPYVINISMIRRRMKTPKL